MDRVHDLDRAEGQKLTAAGVAGELLHIVGQGGDNIDEAEDRRAGAPGDRDRVAQVVVVAVGHKDHRAVEGCRVRGAKAAAGEERVDQDLVRALADEEAGMAEKLDFHMQTLLG